MAPSCRRRLGAVILGLGLSLPAGAAVAQAVAGAAGTGRVRGTVVDAESGVPLHASVVLAPGQRETRSDSAGRFVFNGVPAGDVSLRAAAFGYRPAEATAVVVAGAEVDVRIDMHMAPRTLDVVRTTAKAPEREQFEGPAGASVTSISGRELSNIPALGEADVLRAAALLPGIAARNDFWAGFNVRGGESDQTQVLLDGMPIFSPFHLGGLFSTFIPEAVSEVDARVGALPASYGGRLSGSLDVVSAEDSRGGVHTAIDASVISTSAKVSGALPKVLGSWNLAVRRTYADALANLVVRPGAFPYHFQDAQFHAAALLPHGGTLAFTGYAGLDLLRPSADDPSAFGIGTGGDPNNVMVFDWGNRLAGLTFTQPVGEGSLVQRLSYSSFATRFDGASTGVRLHNDIDEIRAAGEMTRRFLHGAHGVRVGYNLSWLGTHYEERISSRAANDFPDHLVVQDTTISQRSDASALFAEDLWTIGRLTLRPGVRWEQVRHAGWSGVSPRLSAKYRPTDRLALTFAAGRYTQAVHAVRNEDLPIRVVDVWFASDRQVPVSTGTELVGGSELWLTRDDFIRVEGYTKRFGDLVEPASTVDPRLRPSELRRFDGSSYGVDVLARHLATARLSGWISYSYGKSVRFQGGERYFPAHDRRHDFNVVASYRLSARYILAARLGVATGTPYTGWAGTYSRWWYDPVTRRWVPPSPGSMADDEQVRSARNAERYPTYQRLDLSVHHPFRRGRTEFDAFLNVINTLNARNVLLYTFDTSETPSRVRGFSQLPLLPSIGLRVAF